MRILKYFQKIKKKNPKKVEKNTIKNCSEILNFVSSLLPSAAQMANKNVVYRPTVYKTGVRHPYFMGQGKPHNSVKKRDTLHR